MTRGDCNSAWPHRPYRHLRRGRWEQSRREAQSGLRQASQNMLHPFGSDSTRFWRMVNCPVETFPSCVLSEVETICRAEFLLLSRVSPSTKSLTLRTAKSCPAAANAVNAATPVLSYRQCMGK